MFQSISPEQAGISSTCIKQFLQTIEKRGLATHSILMMKGDRIFAEYYWKPFHKDQCHRMYSQTKSYVSIAIGLLEEDGLLSLDDTICSYFPEKIDRELPPYLADMTIRQMLTMETCGETPYWFYHDDPDRTHLYFAENPAVIPAGMRWHYDSPGSQVLSTLVEKLSQKSLFDFLYDRIFRHLGTFQTASILKTKTEDSFGDSALLCTPRDMTSFARLLMNKGVWNGQRLISETYVEEATSRQVDNNEIGFNGILTDGYGYQIWRTAYNGFAFVGMGTQLTVCLPEKDFLFVCTSDNQGYPEANALMLSSLYDIIVENLADSSLPENPVARRETEEYGAGLTLCCLKGKPTSAFEKELSGRTYLCRKNPTGITEFSFEFDGKGGGCFHYTNAQGKKDLPFGCGKNAFGKFPQFGYSDLHACVPSDDPHFMYDCAASTCWAEKQKLLLRVQIIDCFLGNLYAVFSFQEQNATVTMIKNAEAFLDEYNGEFVATLKTE